MDTPAGKYGPKDTNQFCSNHTVGKEIGVAHCCAGALLPPSLVTQVEDKAAEREADQDPGDDEGSDAISSSCGVEAAEQDRIKADRGNEGKGGKGSIRSGGRVI